MKTTQFVVPLDILTWLLPLIIASITALGVWFGPQWVEHRRKRKEIKEKIKRQILTLDSFSEADEEEIEKDWLAIGKDVIKPLRAGLKTTKYERTKRTIVRALYHLGDKEVKIALFSRYEGVLKSSKDSDKMREVLEEIKRLEMVELAPCIFDRLQREKIEEYEMIRTIGGLGYGPALLYLVNLATERLNEGKPDDNILHACIMAIGNIAPKWNELTSEEFHRTIGVFKEALNIEKDKWLIDAVVRCELPPVLELEHDLREPLKKELIETLAKLLKHKSGSISENAVKRLAQLGDKRAVPYLKELLDQEKSPTSLKTTLEWSLRILEQ